MSFEALSAIVQQPANVSFEETDFKRLITFHTCMLVSKTDKINMQLETLLQNYAQQIEDNTCVVNG
jgi:hypothetical protein